MFNLSLTLFSKPSCIGCISFAALLAVCFLVPGQTVTAAETDDELVIMAPRQQQNRLLEDLLFAYRQDTGRKVKTWQPRRQGKPWDVATDIALAGRNGTDMMLTSRVDWEYRADKADRADFDYFPLANQRVYRGNNLVGGVEYGVIVPEKDSSPLVKEFLDWVKGSGRPVLMQPDPHHFVPVDAAIPPFEPSEYHYQAPWDGEKPMMWHGVCHMGLRRLHTTQIAEMKKAWMQGYNQIQGGTFNTEPILEFAEEHGMVIMGFPDVEKDNTEESSDEHPLVQKVRLAREYPSTRMIYASNEDHMTWLYVPLYQAKHWMETGEGEIVEGERKSVSEYIKDKHDVGLSDEALQKRIDEVKKCEAQFREWLKEKHGSLDVLNERWDRSFDSWEEIEMPDLPLDWVKRICEESDFKIMKRRGSWYMTWLLKIFRDPLRFHSYLRDPAYLDFNRFLRTVWARRYKALDHPPAHQNAIWGDFQNHAKDLQPLLKPRKGEEVPGFIYTTKSRPDVFLFREVPEFNALSYDHPGCKMNPAYIQMPVDVQYIAKDKPVWNSEHHLYNHDKSTPSRVRYHLLHTFLMGQYKSSSYNRVRTTEISRRERHIAATQTRDQLQEADKALRALLRARAEADIAVLVTEANRAWNMLPEGPARPELGGAIKAFGHVGALGKQWKYVINEDVSSNHVTGTLIVDAPWLLPDTAKKMAELPEDRRIVAIGELPTKDEYGQDLPEDVVKTLRSRTTVVDGWENLQRVVKPAEGLPDLYKTVGKADFYWWTPVHGRDSYTVPVPKLEVRRARVGDTLYVAVTNHSGYYRRKAPIPWAAGKKIHEYTSHDSATRDVHLSPRIYDEDDKTLFETEAVKIYKLTPAEE